MSEQEITHIWSALVEDPYFLPEEDQYLIEKDESFWNYTVVCQHVTGWEGWQLNWFFEYSEELPTTVERVILRLRYQPFEVIAPVGQPPSLSAGNAPDAREALAPEEG